MRHTMNVPCGIMRSVGKKGELGGGKTGLLYFGDRLDIDILQSVAV